jgi:hypothetical protein
MRRELGIRTANPAVISVINSTLATDYFAAKSFG